jgi:hypothetical protein
MPNKVHMAFEPKSLFIDLSDILPVKQIPKKIKDTRNYRQIVASIEDIGIVEPPVVARNGAKNGKYLLLDGHLRIEALKDLNVDGVTCLIATDDEAFTYNKRINRVATIQVHKMIRKAIERGVSEHRIAKALDVNISTVKQKRRLLDGICAEAAELLKDKTCPVNTFESLKKMKPMRQIEVVELMIAMNSYSVSYSKALLVATPQDQLIDPGQPKSFKGVSADQIATMEREMSKLQGEIKLIEDSYGPDHLNLVLARGYLVSLLSNDQINRYLGQNHPEILSEFKKISEIDSLAGD